MSSKVSTYHGVLEQGHPSGPTNTGNDSLPKRYLNNKKAYQDLLASAKKLLKSDWFKTGWEAGSADAPERAALDVAIYSSFGGLFQAKVDVETYNMLLASLSDDKVDLFSETMIPASRSASTMNTRQQATSELLGLASRLGSLHPGLAIRLAKFVAAEDASPSTDLSEDMKHEADKILKSIQSSIVASDMDGYLENLKRLGQFLPKLASSRIAGEETELAPLADMSDEEVKSFLEKQKPTIQHTEQALKEGDIEKFLAGLNSLIEESENAAKRLKTGSVHVSISTLLRVASTSPQAKALLMPALLVAAKKSKKKTSQKKKTSEKDKKDGPFKGKKAPPFVKKDKKEDPKSAKKDDKPGKGKGRKATVEVLASDTEW